MKFSNFDELIKYLKDEDLYISDLEFTKSEQKKGKPKEGSEGSDSQKNRENNKEERGVKESTIGEYKAKIKSFSDNPEIPLELSNENIIYVNEFTSIPNSCHMGKIRLLNREVYAGICNEDDNSKLDLMLEYQDSDGNFKTIKEEFTLKKANHNTGEKIVLNTQE